jgi:hypothetical protein
VELYLHSHNTPPWSGDRLKKKPRDFTFYPLYADLILQGIFVKAFDMPACTTELRILGQSAEEIFERSREDIKGRYGKLCIEKLRPSLRVIKLRRMR